MAGLVEGTRENYAIHLGGSGGDLTQVMADPVMDLYSNHILLIRLEDFETIREYESTDTIYPASLTKIMTGILAIEALDNFDEKIIIQPEWIDRLKEQNASVAGFLPGEAVTVRDLLYATLLPSGADGAVALACRISGSEDAFARLMNEKALSLGMLHTHFKNATGLHEEGHVTTLQDMALLLDYALDNGVFRRIFTTHQYQTEATNLHEQGIFLESTLFGRLDEAERETGGLVDSLGQLSGGGWILGGKTGYTPEAGLCLASVAQIHDKEYLLLTAGACGSTSTLPYHSFDALEVYSHIQ